MLGDGKQLGAFLLAFHLAVMCPSLCLVHCWLSDDHAMADSSTPHYVCILHTAHQHQTSALAATELSSTGASELVAIFNVVLLIISMMLLNQRRLHSFLAMKQAFHSIALLPQTPPPR